MTFLDRAKKRTFDLAVSALGLFCLWPVIVVTAILAKRDTGASGIFKQQRIGRNGKMFQVFKIRTMRPVEGTTVTTKNDSRITPLGTKLRRWKLDELPQLLNVLVGDMSFVGPRPDVPGFLDRLQGPERELLQLRPGITGPATIKYRNEEEILANDDDPETYNAEVIWPDKVKINLDYMHNWSFRADLGYIMDTVFK